MKLTTGISHLQVGGAFLSLALLVVFATLSFCVYGHDGYDLWFPIVAEYLNGDKYYHFSGMIFNGQNLAAVYGRLPFWPILRFFNTNITQFLNLTHCVWVLSFFWLLTRIVHGVQKRKDVFNLCFCFFYALLAPPVLNKVMAGHLNLLYGILPFFIALALIFDKSKLNIFFSVFILWCSLSMQSYQILIYHNFYVPLFLHVFLKHEPLKKKYSLLLLFIIGAAFSLNLPLFLQMYSHAVSPDNLRNLTRNVVYSALVTDLRDLPQLFITGAHKFISHRHLGFFHEINYSVGSFLVILFYQKKDSALKLTLLLTTVILFLFCMNVPPFNFLSELPFLRSFRVPQRVFLVLGLFVPVWFFSTFDLKHSKRDVLLLFVLLILFFLIPVLELISLVLLTVFLLQRHKEPYRKFALYCALATLVIGFDKKLYPSYLKHLEYLETVKHLQPILDRYTKDELRRTIFHIDTHESLDVLDSIRSNEEMWSQGFSFPTPKFQRYNYVAQSLGIRTPEGYGHPPAYHLEVVYKVSGIKFNSNTNWFYFFDKFPYKHDLLVIFNVAMIADVQADGRVLLKPLEK